MPTSDTPSEPFAGPLRPIPAANLFLVGYRCCGKTSVGRLLAQQSDWKLVDTDALAVQSAGTSIADMVARDGWEAFRSLETHILRSVCRQSCQVVATGGGIVLAADNIRLMRQSGAVVWLQARSETILRRLADDPLSREQRPALTSRTLAEEVNRTLVERKPLYASAKDLMCPTDDLQPAELAVAIRKMLSDAGWRW